jgi:hypothetical protein
MASTQAQLIIHDASTSSPQRIAELVEWLRRQADNLAKDHKDYAPKFRARFFNRR